MSMTNLIKADLYRLTKCKSMIVFLVLLFLMYRDAVGSPEPTGLSLGMAELIGKAPALKPDIGQLTMNFSYYFLFLIPVFNIVTADLNERTVKNTISYGTSRKLYFTSKFLFANLFCAAVFVFANIVFYFANSLSCEKKNVSEFGKFMQVLGFQTAVVIAFVSLFVMAAFVFMKAVSWNSVTIAAPFISSALLMFLYGAKAIKNLGESVLFKFEIGNMLSLIPQKGSLNYDIQCLAVSAAITALSFIVGMTAFCRREIK